MRAKRRRSAFLSTAIAALVGGPSFAADNNATPELLVQQALEADLAGAPADRERLLNAALSLDPDHAPARWQSGYVRIGEDWVRVDEAPRRFSDDPKLAVYRRKREAVVDTADNQRELARWCQKNRLPDEARVHWVKVLEYDARDREALAALGLTEYQGRLLTRAQIAQEKKVAGERLKALRIWQPKALAWRAAIEGNNPQAAAEAEQALRSVTDVAALPALEKVFGIDQAGETSDPLNLLLVEVAERMQQPEATSVLVRRALAAESERVCLAACDALKKRPLYAYVPQLIAAYPGKTSTRFEIHLLPGGTVVHEHAVDVWEGSGDKLSLTYESTLHPSNAATGSVAGNAALAQKARNAAAIEAAAAERESRAETRRKRLRLVFKRTTGFEDADDPELWSKQYADYQHRDEPPRIQPSRAHAYELAGLYPIGSAIRPLAEPLPKQVFRPQGIKNRMAVFNFIQSLPPSMRSCFPAGTPVVSATGTVPIESLTSGDRVLAQDVATGELAYKTVQSTTLRKPVPLVSVRLDQGSVTCSQGHPFWVAGQGWRMACHLQTGDRLVGLGQDGLVAGIEQLPPREVYNLLVSDVGTYFVGEQRLLVHDNSELTEVPVLLPGLANTPQ